MARISIRVIRVIRGPKSRSSDITAKCMKASRFTVPILAFALSPIALATDNPAELLYVRRIAPLFAEKCLSCHGNDEHKIKGGFDMRSLGPVRKGGIRGEPSVVTGQPEASPLYRAATRQHEDDWKPMPPKDADKLYA